MPIDFPTVKYADPATFPPAAPAATDAVMARTSGGADKSFVLGNLAGLAPLVVTADQSAYYTGSAWAAYTVTSVGRTLLAATTQALQRTALGLGDAAVQNIGTSGANVPLLNGANTWAAVQTFSVSPVFSAGLTIPSGQALMLGATTALLSGGGGITVLAGAGATTSMILRPSGSGSTTGQITVNADGTTSFTNVVIASGGFRPAADNAADIGTAAIRVRTYYGVNSAINTSDARAKTEPRQLRQAEAAAFAQIARLPAIWRWLSRVNGDGCEPEGREARKHGGPTVQAAMAIMEAHGLDPMEFACFCYDQWEAQPEQWHEWAEELGEDGDVIREAGRELVQEAVEAGDRYSFRKEELLCLIVSAMAAQHDALEARVAALEAGRTP